jgi:hypothetical protein
MHVFSFFRPWTYAGSQTFFPAGRGDTYRFASRQRSPENPFCELVANYFLL